MWNSARVDCDTIRVVYSLAQTFDDSNEIIISDDFNSFEFVSAILHTPMKGNILTNIIIFTATPNTKWTEQFIINLQWMFFFFFFFFIKMQIDSKTTDEMQNVKINQNEWVKKLIKSNGIN